MRPGCHAAARMRTASFAPPHPPARDERKTFGAAIGRAPSEEELTGIFALYPGRHLSEERDVRRISSPRRVAELLMELSDDGIMRGLVSDAMEVAPRA